MAEPPSPIKATPKRKRDDVTNEQLASYSLSAFALPKTAFSFQPPSLKPVNNPRCESFEDGNSSPRTKVAQKFQELALESGGGVILKDKADGTVVVGTGADEVSPNQEPSVASPRFSPELPIFEFDASSGSGTAVEDMQLDDDDNTSRKRIKLPDLHDDGCQDTAAAMGLNGDTGIITTKPIQPDEPRHFTLQTAVDPTIVESAKSNGSGRLQKSYPSINRLSDSKSRSRRRAGTPPLSKRKTTELQADEEPATFTDPVRAALTWHEDEITVYDPADKDDDGTGINGIGFKPTPAIAYARAQKRRQQLAEYKKREESEARARRNQRRRGQLNGGPQLERDHSIVRVHFSDAEPTTVVTT
ncbi:hypothetical protein AAE478_010395 [Parahypoxylon ruwenzoriense]